MSLILLLIVASECPICIPTQHSNEYLEQTYPITYRTMNKAWIGSCESIIDQELYNNAYRLDTAIIRGAFNERLSKLSPSYPHHQFLGILNIYSLQSSGQCISRDDHYAVMQEYGNNTILVDIYVDGHLKYHSTRVFSDSKAEYTSSIVSYSQIGREDGVEYCHWRQKS